MNEGKELKIRLLVVDDHLVVRQGVKFLLLSSPEVEVVGEAATGEEAVEQVQLLRPNVVLMDVRMPGMNGIEATLAIRSGFPAVGVIMLSSYDERELVQGALKAGASDYLLKGVDARALLEGIQRVYQKEVAFAPGLLQPGAHRMDAVAPLPSQGEIPEVDPLSKREKEILRLIGEGMTNSQIAQELNYAVGTVKNMVRDLFLKLQVSDRAQAVLKGVRLGILR